MKEARRRKCYTQEELAETVGVSPGFISEIERGLKTPGMETFAEIAEALGSSGDYLIFGEIYICDELNESLKELTPRQRKTAEDILTAYISGR